jgi:uncharacterized protein
MRAALQRFIRRLRSRGLEISPGEHLDALAAVQVLRWEDARAFREALRATLVKRQDHFPVFDAEFARFFAPPPLPPGENKGKQGAGGSRRSGQGHSRGQSEEGRGQVQRDEPEGPALTPGQRPGGESTSQAPGATSHAAEPERHGELPGRTHRVTFHADRAPEEPRSHEALLRAELRRLSPAEVADLRRHVRLMARRVATRLSRRRRAARAGAVDLKRTVRLSLATGGVPFRLAHRTRRISRPDILVLCDVSGSVLRAADLMLEFLQALRGVAGRLRIFGYTNRVADLTGLWSAREPDLRAALEASDLDLQAFSDFGGACYDLLTRFPGAITRHTTLLVMGDARNNYGDAMTWAFADLAAPAHRVIWLVPEVRQRWNTGDSQIAEYQPLCGTMAECHTLERLLRALQRVC